jgi:hypothetical protein
VPLEQAAEEKEEKKLARERAELALQYENEKRREQGLPPLASLDPPSERGSGSTKAEPVHAAPTVQTASSQPAPLMPPSSSPSAPAPVLTSPSRASHAQAAGSPGGGGGGGGTDYAAARQRARARLFGDDGDVASAHSGPTSPPKGPMVDGRRDQHGSDTLSRRGPAMDPSSPTTMMLRQRDQLQQQEIEAQARHLKFTAQVAVESVRESMPSLASMTFVWSLRSNWWLLVNTEYMHADA